MDKRYGRVEWGPHRERHRTSAAYWGKPLIWNRKSNARAFKREYGRRQRVFCASLADVFDNKVDSTWRKDLFALIRQCRRLDYLILTKRPQNISKMLPSNWQRGYGYPNVWLGITAEDQARYYQRWPRLSMIRARVKFVSYEPAIGPSQLGNLGPYPDWVIFGGESGGGARRLEPQWIRDIIAECHARGVVPFDKQWGTYSNNPPVVEQGMVVADARRLDNQGKGGGLVDGKLVCGFPTP